MEYVIWGVPWCWVQRMMLDAPRYVSKEELQHRVTELQPQDAEAFAAMMNQMIENNGRRDNEIHNRHTGADQ